VATELHTRNPPTAAKNVIKYKNLLELLRGGALGGRLVGSDKGRPKTGELEASKSTVSPSESLNVEYVSIAVVS